MYVHAFMHTGQTFPFLEIVSIQKRQHQLVANYTVGGKEAGLSPALFYRDFSEKVIISNNTWKNKPVL